MTHSLKKKEKQGLIPIIAPVREKEAPLYAQLHENIKQYIQDNALKSGDRMPSEKELILQLGLSRMTVRLATQGLASEGLITRIRGKGTYVAEPKSKDHLRGTQSLEMRFNSQGTRITNLLLNHSLAYTASVYTNALNLPLSSQVYKIRRLKKIGDSVLGVETRLLMPEMKGIFTEDELNRESLVDLLGKNPKTRIGRISYWVSCSIAMELEVELLEISPESQILIQHGIFYNSQNRPIMTGRIVYPADKMEIHYEVNSQHEEE